MSKPMKTMSVRLEEDTLNTLNEIVEDINDSDIGIGVNTASIIRASIDNFIKDYLEKVNNTLKISINTPIASEDITMEDLTMEQHEWLVLASYELYMSYRSLLTEDSSKEDIEFAKKLHFIHSQIFSTYPALINMDKFHKIDNKYQNKTK